MPLDTDGMTAPTANVTQDAVDAFVSPYMDLWLYYREHRWEFIRDCLVTRNGDAAPGQPRDAVPFPDHPHLEFVTGLWRKERRLQIDKSRQLTLTWLLCACNVHDLLHEESWLAGFQSTGLKNACDKLENYMLYMIQRVPHDAMMPWVKEGDDPPKAWIEHVARHFSLSLEPPTPPKATRSPYYGSEGYWLAYRLTNKYTTSSGGEGLEEINLLNFFTTSKNTVMAVANGANGEEKWRGYTFNVVNHDEAWFYEGLSDTLNSASKAAGTHGFQVIVSTASMGKDGDSYPAKAVEKDPGVDHDAYAQERGYVLPHGVELWRTRMRYTHVRIWYYTRPERDTDEWREENIQTGDIRKNLREILIQYDVPENEPFYPQYVRTPAAYELKADYEPVDLLSPEGRGVTLVIGQDGGRTPHSVICEVYPTGKVVPTFTVDVVGSIASLIIPLKATLARHYPGWEHRHEVVADPTMWNKSEASDVSAAQLMQQAGFVLIPGNNDTDARYQSMSRLLEDKPFGNPEDWEAPADEIDLRFGQSRRLQVGPKADKLRTALNGGSDLDSNAAKNGLNVKNKRSPYSHVMDAMEYVAVRVVGLLRARGSGSKAPPVHKRQRRVGGAR